MRPAAVSDDHDGMQTRAAPGDSPQPARIMLIDDHEISRAACRALLRTEGAEVVADLGASDQAIAAAAMLRPDVAVIDVTPLGNTGFDLAGQLRALPRPPAVILTSSTDRTAFGARLKNHPFIAKSDLCAATIAQLAASHKTGTITG
jgi:DNA-binding NarL/FixJ family response regulator